MSMKKSSWQNVHTWYSKETHNKGHYYHQHVILPRVQQLLNIQPYDRVLDLACGSGVFGRTLPKHVTYTGIDIAPGLIEAARKQDRNPLHKYLVGDIEQLSIQNSIFTIAMCLLAIQNVQDPKAVFLNASRLLEKGGRFVIVMNHPTFRIPRQSSWGIDEQTKQQYRRINRYMSPLEIPMTMHPGKGKKSPVTWSYHFPLSCYVQWLREAGFVITHLEEWTSDKESQIGKTGKMENKARNEIPLFLTIVAKNL